MEDLGTYEIIKESSAMLALLEIEIEISESRIKKLNELRELILGKDNK